MEHSSYRDVEGFPGYRVSSEGVVESRWGRGKTGLTDRWKVRKLTPNRGGYLTLNFSRNGLKVRRSVHHVVLEAFVGPRPTGLICCHFDGNRRNNRVDNLRWDTYQSNSDDMRRHGTVLRGSRAKSKLREDQVLEIRRLRATGTKVKNLAEMFGVSKQSIEGIIYRRTWRHVA